MRQVFYNKMRQFYWKNATFITNCMILLQNATVITKYEVYYKIRQYDDLFYHMFA